jgi:ABC-type glycerol-3-phosphate transport system permease component
MFTLPRALMAFRGTYVIRFGPLNAGIILAALPPIILYSLFSDRIRKSMAISIQKG